MGLKFVRRASFATTDVWESDASQNNSAQNDLGFRLALHIWKFCRSTIKITSAYMENRVQ